MCPLTFNCSKQTQCSSVSPVPKNPQKSDGNPFPLTGQDSVGLNVGVYLNKLTVIVAFNIWLSFIPRLFVVSKFFLHNHQYIYAPIQAKFFQSCDVRTFLSMGNAITQMGRLKMLMTTTLLHFWDAFHLWSHKQNCNKIDSKKRF